MPRLISNTYIEISGRGNMTKTQTIFHNCPRCSAKANIMKVAEVNEVFGFRNMAKPTDKKRIDRPQSLCRLCRSAHARVVREFKASNKKLANVDLRSHRIGKGKKKTLVRASTGKQLSHKVKTKAKKISKVTKKVTKKIKSKKSKKKN